MTDVVVVGAGPVGALLAAELQRHGVEVRVLERRPTSGHGSRAIGVHVPVLAALERSGITGDPAIMPNSCTTTPSPLPRCPPQAMKAPFSAAT